jgi:glucose 1-dehydrogenase
MSVRRRAVRILGPYVERSRERRYRRRARPMELRPSADWGIGPSPPDLAARLAVVTGAARGIGLAIAQGLQAAGARVIVIDRDGDALTQAFSADSCIPVEADLAAADTSRLAERLLREHGPIELIVNNVGLDWPRRFFDVDEDDFDRIYATNLRGPWFFTRPLTAELLRQGRKGSVLFVSSTFDRLVHLFPVYSTSKAAVAMLMRELAYELAPHGIRVNALSPGWVYVPTRPWHKPNPDAVALIPMGRPQQPDDIARMALVLLSDLWSGNVTGQNVGVDGGASLVGWGDRALRRV